MSAKVAIYAPVAEVLGVPDLQHLVGHEDITAQRDIRGRPAAWHIRWNDVAVTMSLIPSEELTRHLLGLCNYVRSLVNGTTPGETQALLERIASVRLVYNIEITPDFDGERKAEQFVLGMVQRYQAFLLANDGIYDEQGYLLVGPTPAAPAAAGQPTPAQLARVARSQAILSAYQVPPAPEPIYTEDDETVLLRTPAEAAQRALMLWAVVLRAEGMPQPQTMSLIERMGVGGAASPAETQFLQKNILATEESTRFLWRLESLWALMWALQYIDELPWPANTCDVDRLAQELRQRETDPEFITHSVLRPRSELLDALDWTRRLHWVLGEAFRKRQRVPSNLQWSHVESLVAIEACPATGVVEERHHALNWLIRFQDADWDDVTKST